MDFKRKSLCRTEITWQVIAVLWHLYLSAQIYNVLFFFYYTIALKILDRDKVIFNNYNTRQFYLKLILIK